MMNRKKMRNLLYTAALAAGIAAAATGCARKAETPAQTTAAESSTAPETSAEAAETNIAETVKETTASDKSEDTASENMVGMITGTVKDAGMSTVVITNQKYPEGITFLKEDAATGFAEGLLADHEITIFYSGEIKDGDASGVTVELLRDKRDGDDTSEAAKVSGTVVSIGMSVISIETEDGKIISFEQDPKPVNMAEGPVEGDKVTIIYSYQDESNEGAVVPELIRN